MNTHRRVVICQLCVAAVMCTSSLLAQDAGAKIVVTNPAAIVRPQEPVLVAWSTVMDALPGLGSASVTVSDERGRLLMNQVDDIDADGTPDEMVFVADFGPGQSRTFTFKPGPKPTGLAAPPVRTDAGNWKKAPTGNHAVDDDDGPGYLRGQGGYLYDGIGWESELSGYRLYLDERNAVDIQGKRVPGLYWNYIGSSSVDYQADADWGMDVLHVGPALGIGGFGFWSGDSVVKPLVVERRRTRIIARGPVRAIVRVDYTGWKVGEERLNAVSVYTIYAGERMTEHRLTVLNGGGRAIATGIVKHAASTVQWDSGGSILSSDGPQSRSGEALWMAIQVRPSDVLRRTADASNDIILLNAGPTGRVRYLICSSWEGERGGLLKGVARDEEISRAQARLEYPIVVANQR